MGLRYLKVESQLQSRPTDAIVVVELGQSNTKASSGIPYVGSGTPLVGTLHTPCFCQVPCAAGPDVYDGGNAHMAAAQSNAVPDVM